MTPYMEMKLTAESSERGRIESRSQLDAALAREAALREELARLKVAAANVIVEGDALQQRLIDAEKLFDAAVTALNEISKVSRIGEKPFEIATLAIGEMSVLKPVEGEGS